jgi:hypothetical protein
MIISLPNGKFLHKSLEEMLSIKDEEIDMWYQNMIADNMGDDSLNPFTSFRDVELMEFDIPDIEE